MKRLLLVLSIYSISLPLLAQKNFEGNADFIMRMASDSSPVLRIQAWFGHKKIKAQTTVLKNLPGLDARNETLILDFKRGTISRVNQAEEKVEIESMTGQGKKEDIKHLYQTSDTKEIMGYQCTAYTTGDMSKTEKKDTAEVKITASITIWYANNLSFRIKKKLKYIQMVPLFTNDHLALGSSININAGGLNLHLVTAAQNIHPGPVPASAFMHPAGFTVQNKK